MTMIIKYYILLIFFGSFQHIFSAQMELVNITRLGHLSVDCWQNAQFYLVKAKLVFALQIMQ
jgi:hypothetical protein